MVLRDKEFYNTSIEVWRDIKGYDGIYQVSNFGRIKSIRFYKKKGIWVERLMIPQRLLSGHLHVILRKNGKGTVWRVHRLVALAFIPNPDNLPYINHKDENPANNFVHINTDNSVDLIKSNLEWCTAKYNCNYGTRKQRLSLKNKNHVSLSKPVEQYNLKGEFIMEYPSMQEAGRVLNIKSYNISACCNCRENHATCGGFQWKFKDSEKIIINLDWKINQYDKNGIKIASYNTAKEASINNKISHTSILNCLCGLSKSAGGFVWRKEINK